MPAHHLERILCGECDRLQEACRHATQEHLQLVHQLKLDPAAGKQKAEGLVRKVNTAEFTKRKAEQAWDAHRQETGHR